MKHLCDMLFVYGTLLSSYSNPESIRLKQENIFLGPAYIKGSLFEIDGYPGAIQDPVSRNTISGELYRIRELAKTFKWLDQYEEADPENNPHPEYKRILVPVYYRDRIISAWMYQYSKSTEGFREIPSGDYLNHLSGQL